mmetsp:Transcript_73240/g.172116  ORF Transcript_73240/g.172116 Transcript_73240/m.172116 type:complete len:414 (-) Transcript_73240:111-1352(-)
MCVLRSQLPPSSQARDHRLPKVDNFRVPGNVGHAQLIALATSVRHSLDFDEVWVTSEHQLRVAFDLVGVVFLDKGHAEDGALPLGTKGVDASEEPLPVVAKQRSVDLLECIWVGSVDGDVELCDRDQRLHLVGELGVGDEEGADPLGVEAAEEGVDVRVHDGLADEGQRAMPDASSLFQTLHLDPRKTLHLLEHLAVIFHHALNQCVRVVCFPAPARAHRVGVVAPAEHTLVGTRETRCRLHALVARNAVEGVLVTPPSSSEHGFGPATELDAAVGANQLVALLGELATQRVIQHLLGRGRLLAPRNHPPKVLHVRNVGGIAGLGGRGLGVSVTAVVRGTIVDKTKRGTNNGPHQLLPAHKSFSESRFVICSDGVQASSASCLEHGVEVDGGPVEVVLAVARIAEPANDVPKI